MIAFKMNPKLYVLKIVLMNLCAVLTIPANGGHRMVWSNNKIVPRCDSTANQTNSVEYMANIGSDGNFPVVSDPGKHGTTWWIRKPYSQVHPSSKTQWNRQVPLRAPFVITKLAKVPKNNYSPFYKSLFEPLMRHRKLVTLVAFRKDFLSQRTTFLPAEDMKKSMEIAEQQSPYYNNYISSFWHDPIIDTLNNNLV